MKKHYLRAVFLLMIGALLFGYADGQAQTRQPLFIPYALEVDQYEPKVDNFMVILDKSSSMSWKYNGERRLTIAKDFLSAMNQTLPDMKLNGAFRTFQCRFSVPQSEDITGVIHWAELPEMPND